MSAALPTFMTTIATTLLANVIGGTSSPQEILGVCQSLDAGRAAAQRSNDSAALGYTGTGMAILDCWDRIKAAGGTPRSTP